MRIGTDIDGGAFGGRPDATIARPRTGWLWTEFTLLFLGVPALMAFVLSPRLLYGLLLGMTALGLVLLAVTPGWRWKRLIEGWRWRDLAYFLVFSIGAAGVIYGFVMAYAPYRLLAMPLRRPELWLTIMALYPLVLALPQEILFRALFFGRYGRLFGADRPDRVWIAIAANALVFGLAHLFYWNALAIGLSMVGSVFFAHAYLLRGSFPLAFFLHAVAGQLVFSLGLGVYFYHGAIPGG